MQSTYQFDFVLTVSNQLLECLEGMTPTPMTVTPFKELIDLQSKSGSPQGVYVIYHKDLPVYVGKADDVEKRLRKHFKKLCGRLNIDMETVAYKALLLDKSMSTAANERLLIKLFSDMHGDMWNGSGFGPNDPGKKRDETKQNAFDTEFPINENFLIECSKKSTEKVALKTVIKTMKNSLPYNFRHGPLNIFGEKLITVSNQMSARDLLQIVVNRLGAGWHGAILGHGLTLYQKKPRSDAIGSIIVPLKTRRIKKIATT